MIIILILYTLAIQWLRQAMPSLHLLLIAGIGLTRRFRNRHSLIILLALWSMLVSVPFSDSPVLYSNPQADQAQRP